MTKYIIGEIFSSGGATLHKNPSDQTVSIEVKSKSALSFNCKINLVIFAIAEILGGFTFSLLSPFYTQEATSKNLTVSQTGMVRK